jgi:hypothetical protein
MRRLSVILGLFTAIAVPAAALAATSAAGDGSLVVKNGQAPWPSTTPVVSLTITGSVIGQVDHGKLIIDAGPNADLDAQPQVTGAEWRGDSTKSPTAQIWKGSFKFRAVGGSYTVLVYGTNVNLVAVGTGTVKLAGLPDTPSGDGKYSLNGGDFVSLPGTQSDKRIIGSNG